MSWPSTSKQNQCLCFFFMYACMSVIYTVCVQVPVQGQKKVLEVVSCLKLEL